MLSCATPGMANAIKVSVGRAQLKVLQISIPFKSVSDSCSQRGNTLVDGNSVQNKYVIERFQELCRPTSFSRQVSDRRLQPAMAQCGTSQLVELSGLERKALRRVGSAHWIERIIVQGGVSIPRRIGINVSRPTPARVRRLTFRRISGICKTRISCLQLVPKSEARFPPSPQSDFGGRFGSWPSPSGGGVLAGFNQAPQGPSDTPNNEDRYAMWRRRTGLP